MCLETSRPLLDTRRPPLRIGPFRPPYFVSDFIVEGTHIAANGDELWVSGVGVLVQSLVDGSSGIVGSGTIEGGTGRFTGATGAFDIEGLSGEAKVFEGWIAFDASNRASLP